MLNYSEGEETGVKRNPDVNLCSVSVNDFHRTYIVSQKLSVTSEMSLHKVGYFTASRFRCEKEPIV